MKSNHEGERNCKNAGFTFVVFLCIFFKIQNVDFYCDDWHSFDIEAAGYLHRFDLVFAHMTPAIQSAATFEKLSKASKGWGVLTKPIRRIDPVSDAVKELVVWMI